MAVMEGYPAIAQIMSSYDELAIFRRFKELNIQDALYLQAEIIHLKEELEDLRKQDAEFSDKAAYQRDWYSIAQSEEDEDKRQWKKILEIRTKLDQYNDRLAKLALLSSLEGPNHYDLSFFRDWLERPNMGNFPLRGLDQHAWDKEFEKDLLAIRRRSHGDPFSRWLVNRAVPKFYRIFGPRLKKPIPESPLSEIAYFPEKPLMAGVHVLGTVIASLLPITSIVILYFIPNLSSRLGVVVTFTALFAICLTLLTQAKRIEIFAATSAFAAVQVVFISGNVVVLP